MMPLVGQVHRKHQQKNGKGRAAIYRESPHNLFILILPQFAYASAEIHTEDVSQRVGALNFEDDFDPWTRLPTVSQPQQPAPQFETIKGIEPLGDQFGAEKLKTVPQQLWEVLFGAFEQPEIARGNLEGAPATNPSLHTYAILDGAKIANLPELLDASGLEHRCLFKGAAYDELKDVAPWIVRLEDGDVFTRNLFSRSDAPWHLWDKEPGIYFRSTFGTKMLGAHFRRFVKLQGADQSWRYFRFWEPLTLQAYLSAAARRPNELCPMFYSQEAQMVSSFVCCPVPGDVTVHKIACEPLSPDNPVGPKFTQDHERAIARAMQGRRQLEIAQALRKGFHQETHGLHDDELSGLVDRVVQRTSHYHIRSVRHVHIFAAWQLIYGADFEARDPTGQAQQILAAPLQEEQKMLHLKHRLNDLHSAGLL